MTTVSCTDTTITSSYAKMSPWIRKDVKLFCSCIAPKHKTRDLAAAGELLAEFEKRDLEASQDVEEAIAKRDAGDLEDVFEKRDASQIAQLVSEAHRISGKKPSAEEEFENESQSFFGPPRLQRFGHGGSLVRRRKTVVKTVIEEEFE